MSPPTKAFRIVTPKGRVLEAKDFQELIAELYTGATADLEAAEYAEDLAAATGNPQTKRAIDLLARGMHRCGELKRELAAHLQERLFPEGLEAPEQERASRRVTEEAREQRRQDILVWWKGLTLGEQARILAQFAPQHDQALRAILEAGSPVVFDELSLDIKNAVSSYAVQYQLVPLVPHA